METIKSFEHWLEVVEQEKQLLLFVKTNNCSVCDGLYPQVAELQEEYQVPFYRVNVVDVPEVAGQLSLFAAPVVLLFNESHEYARFARFVQMDELKRRLVELIERGNTVD